MFKTLKDIFTRRELLWIMAASSLKKSYGEFLLGYLWWIVEPLLMMMVYWVFIVIIQGRVGHNYPFFILCGLVPFRALAMNMGHATTSISSNFNLLSQMNFPRIFLPLVGIIENHIKLIFGYLVLIVLALKFGVGFSPKLLALVAPFTMQLLFMTGVALLFSVIGVYVRDLVIIVNFINRFIVFLTPVLYSIERVPERFRDIYLMNPLGVVVLEARACLMDTPGVTSHQLWVGWAITLGFLLAGYALFVAKQGKIMKVL